MLRVRVLRTTTTGDVSHKSALETWRPELTGGRTPARPSLVLTHEPTFEPADLPLAERVRFEWDGSVLRAHIPWEEGTTAYGLGERAGPMVRNDRKHLCWNTDAWCYGEESPALYQSHPWVLAVRPDGEALGILVDTPRRGLVSVAADGVDLAFEDEPYDVHLIDGRTPEDVLRALAALVGTTPRAPRWALGYHQCRWSYMNTEEVTEVARRMREEGVPCDAIWLDIDHMDGFRPFTFDAERFAEPDELTSDLLLSGFRTVAIIDPGIQIADDNQLCADGLAGRHFVEDAEERPVAGRVWPGRCHFPDFTRASTRAWWAGKVKAFVEDAGLAGLWCDMNEPALFGVPAGTLPDDARHRGAGGGSHAKFHNLYGQLMAEATRAGLTAARPKERPFVLTRAAHLAGAHTAATWTGDNQARWEDLRWAVPMVLNLGLSGQPFSGPDLGGFYGDPSSELFVRWYELGAYLPFCRGHGHKDSCRKEPWAFDGEVLQHVRVALERRMRLMPTLVTLFEEAHQSGLPVCRPLFFADPTDLRLLGVDDTFLLGDDLLVAPVLEPGTEERRVVLPHVEGGWFPFPAGGARIEEDDTVLPAPLGQTPVLARAGSIVVEGDTLQHTGEADTLRVWHVFLDLEGRATGRVFEDDGETREGQTLMRSIEVWVKGSDVLRVRVTDEGEHQGPEEQRRVIVHGMPHREEPYVRDAPLSGEFDLILR